MVVQASQVFVTSRGVTQRCPTQLIKNLIIATQRLLFVSNVLSQCNFLSQNSKKILLIIQKDPFKAGVYAY